MGPGPLTGNPEFDKDIAEERQRRMLEEVEAERIAKGDSDVHEGDYQPITDEEGEMIETPERNRFVRRDE